MAKVSTWSIIQGQIQECYSGGGKHVTVGMDFEILDIEITKIMNDSIEASSPSQETLP